MKLKSVKKVLNNYSHLFIKAYIYGSTIIGNQDEYSDVDLILVRETSLDFFNRIREVTKLVLELGRVDIMIYTPAELEDILNSPGREFIKSAVSGGLLIEGTQGRGSKVVKTGTKRP